MDNFFLVIFDSFSKLRCEFQNSGTSIVNNWYKLLIVVSSSGNSKNIKELVKFSKKKGVKVIGFSGFDGGYLKKNSD